jgi:O-antigen/teichoic acid export membrane protein
MLRSVLSNTFFSLISDVANRLSSALLLILIARELGESAAGVFTLSTNYVLILSAVALWGLDQLLIRDVAHDRSRSSQYFRHFLVIRVVLAPLLWLLLVALLFGLRPYTPDTNRFIALVGGTLLGTSVSNLGQSLLIALERVWLSALASLVSSALLLTASVISIAYGGQMEILALILVLSNWGQAAMLTWMVRGHLQRVGSGFDLGFCWRQLGAGFPFVPIGLFIAVEAQLGSILLSLFHSEAMVGYYGMANVIISGLALLSQALRVGIFPAMARLYRVEHPRFVRLYERSWRYLTMVSLPAVILLILLSDQIIRMVYQQSAPEAVATLQWLAPTLIFYFLNIPNARLMILDGQQKILARLFAISTAANVAAGLLLIPGYGAQAVGIARLVSMSVFFSLNLVYVERNILPSQPWRFVWPSVVSSAVMALVVFAILPAWPAYARGLVGIATYGVLLVGLRAIPADEWAWLRRRLAAWTLGMIRRR